MPAPRGSTDPTGSGQNSNRNSPFDLAGGFIIFTPNSGGGYDIRTTRTPTAPSSVSRTVTLAGTIFDANGQPIPRAEVEVFSSVDLTFHVMTNTDAQGRYTCAGVPAGGTVNKHNCHG